MLLHNHCDNLDGLHLHTSIWTAVVRRDLHWKGAIRIVIKLRGATNNKLSADASQKVFLDIPGDHGGLSEHARTWILTWSSLLSIVNQ